MKKMTFQDLLVRSTSEDQRLADAFEEARIYLGLEYDSEIWEDENRVIHTNRSTWPAKADNF